MITKEQQVSDGNRQHEVNAIEGIGFDYMGYIDKMIKKDRDAGYASSTIKFHYRDMYEDGNIITPPTA